MVVQPDLAETVSPSPPTQRAVAVVELLVASDEPLRVSEIIRRLGLNRATCTAILDALEQLEWVERVGERSYRPGAGLIPVANAVRRRLPVLQTADPLMRDMVQRYGVEAATLSRLDGGYLSLVETVNRDPDVDSRPSFRLPLFPPFGASVVAFALDDERRRWLELVADVAVREHIATTLESVRRHGVAVWHHDQAGRLLQDALATSRGLARRLAGQHCDPVGERQLVALALAMGRSGFTTAQLCPSAQPFAVSYLAAPVFDALDQPCFSLEMHVLRSDVRIDELRTWVSGLRAGADELTVACGGDATRFDWHPLP
jgi:DNA-binding IclR family transcriptional regulator